MFTILFVFTFAYGILVRFLTLLLPTTGQKGWNVIATILTRYNLKEKHVGVSPYLVFSKMSDYLDRLKEHEKEDVVFHFLRQIVRFSTESTLERYLQSAYNGGQLVATLAIKMFST